MRKEHGRWNNARSRWPHGGRCSSERCSCPARLGAPNALKAPEGPGCRRETGVNGLHHLLQRLTTSIISSNPCALLHHLISKTRRDHRPIDHRDVMGWRDVTHISPRLNPALISCPPCLMRPVAFDSTLLRSHPNATYPNNRPASFSSSSSSSSSFSLRDPSPVLQLSADILVFLTQRLRNLNKETE